MLSLLFNQTIQHNVKFYTAACKKIKYQAEQTFSSWWGGGLRVHPTHPPLAMSLGLLLSHALREFTHFCGARLTPRPVSPPLQ